MWSALDVILRYATDVPVAIATLLDAVRPAFERGGRDGSPARVCELGFGPGWFLEEMLAAFPGVKLLGLDLSRPAVESAVADSALRRAGQRAIEVLQGDMERLPFGGGAFDALVTCWTLYFMRDIDAALAGMRRCVREGGWFVTATVAPDHMREFDETVGEAVRRALGREREPDIGARFDLATGLAPMQRAFGDVDVREYSGEIVLPDVATAMVLWPGYGPQLADAEEDAAARVEFERMVSEVIALEGVWRMRRHDGVFVATVRQ